MHLIGNSAPLLVILGPTAIGKTGLAIQLAQALNGEIIGADSRQIYKYMDIGTAKPTLEERQQATHHLVDFVEPDQNFALAEYQERAYQAIDNVLAQGKLPLLVGGTGQYLTAVIEGWSIPRVPPNFELRAQLEAEAEMHGNPHLHERLVKVDPDAAEKIHPNNARRVIRALEVYLETGTPISVLQQKKPPPYRIRTIGLQMEREPLYARADKRVDLMLAAGFLAEVQQLLDKGYAANLPAMSALGYRELADHLQQDADLDEMIERIKFNTHDFIRKQEIWFRGHDNGILWHNTSDLDVDSMIDTLTEWIQN